MHRTVPVYSRSFLNGGPSVRLSATSVRRLVTPVILFSHSARCPSSCGSAAFAAGGGGGGGGGAGGTGCPGGWASATDAASRAARTKPAERIETTSSCGGRPRPHRLIRPRAVPE